MNDLLKPDGGEILVECDEGQEVQEEVRAGDIIVGPFI
jgi:hypothetical protein